MGVIVGLIKRHWLFLSAAALFFLIRIPFFMNIEFEFNADEAVNGLMAMHILEGKSFPIFMYGQSYMGAIEPWLAALFFKFTGPSIFALRVTPLIASFIMLIFVYLTGRIFFRRTVCMIFLLFAATLLPPYLLAYSLSVTAGRFYSIAIGSALYFFYFKYFIPDPGRKRALLLALMAGSGFYVDKLFLHFILPLLAVYYLKDFYEYFKSRRKSALSLYMAFFLVLSSSSFIFSFILPGLINHGKPFMLLGFIRFSSSRSALNLWLITSVLMMLPYTVFFVRENFKEIKSYLPAVLTGFLAGYSPYIYYKLTFHEVVFGHANFYLTKNISIAFKSLLEINLEKASFFTLCYKSAVPFVLTLLILALVYSSNSWKVIDLKKLHRSPVFIYALSVLAGIFAFLLSSMTDFSSFRYLGSFMVVLPILLTFSLKNMLNKKPPLAVAFVILYLFLACFQIHTYYSDKKLYTSQPVNHPLMNNNIDSYRELAEILSRKKLGYSFSDYWISYVLTFVSQEKHISSPPKHQWIRIKEHLDLVTAAERKAYIYKKNRAENLKIQPGFMVSGSFETSKFRVVIVERKSI